MSLRRLTGKRRSDRNFVYLLMLVRKYGLEPVVLHNALLKAKEKRKSTCGPLSIVVRSKEDNMLTFMFILDDRAVAQTTLSQDSLTKLLAVPVEFTRLLHDRNRPFTAVDCGELERRIAGRLESHVLGLETPFQLSRRGK